AARKESICRVDEMPSDQAVPRARGGHGSGVRQSRQLGRGGLSGSTYRAHSSFVRLRPARRQRAAMSFCSLTIQSLIWPSAPPLTSRPSHTASDQIALPCRRISGSPAPSFGQSLILPSSPPLASCPSHTASDLTQLPCWRILGFPVPSTLDQIVIVPS